MRIRPCLKLSGKPRTPRMEGLFMPEVKFQLSNFQLPTCRSARCARLASTPNFQLPISKANKL
jgi:hypothetical protein